MLAMLALVRAVTIKAQLTLQELVDTQPVLSELWNLDSLADRYWRSIGPWTRAAGEQGKGAVGCAHC